MGFPRTNWALHLSCAMILLLVLSQLVAFGANDPLLAAFAASANLFVALVVFIILKTSKSFWRRLAPVIVLFVLTLAWALGSLARQDFRVEAARLEFIKLLGFGAVFLAGAQIGAVRAGARAVAAWFGPGLLCYVLFGLWMWRVSPDAVFGYSKGFHAGRFSASLLNANAAACVTVATALVASGMLGSWLEKPDRYPRVGLALPIFAGITICIAGWATLMTASRTAIGFLVVALLLAVVLGRQVGPRARWVRWSALAIGIVLAAVALVGKGPDFSERQSAGAGAGSRLDAYRLYVEAIREAPVLGHGLGSFQFAHQARLTPENAEVLWNFGAAHQIVLQAALEGGAPYAALLVGIWACVAGQVALSWRSSIFDRSIASGLGLAAGMILLSGMMDIALTVPALVAFFCLLTGLTWGIVMSRIDPKPRPPKST